MPTIYNKVVLDGTTLMDISDTTATASDVAQGKYFYTTAGVKTEGTASGSSGTPAISVVDTTDSHGGTVREITALDISDTTAIASDVASGKYFYTANGTKTLGTASGSSSPTLVTKEITANGTYSAQSDNADGYSSVTVNVPSSGITPTGSINITTNGTHDVTNYASAVVNVSSGGGTPSATKHTIHFDFSDETDTDIDVYYDDALLTTMIQDYTPATYGQKTVILAQLDGVTWYEPASIPLNTQLIDYTKCLQNTAIDPSGQEATMEWYYASDYSPVATGMTFAFTCGWWTYVAFYDSSKTFIRAFEVYNSGIATQDEQDSNLGHGTLTGNTIPSNAAYIRMTSTATNSNYMSLIRTA